MAEDSKFMPPAAGTEAYPAADPARRDRIISQILDAKTSYDAEFDRLHDTFAPMIAALDKGRTPRAVIFIDPLKYAAARAEGVNLRDFLQASADRQAQGHVPVGLVLAINMVDALGVQDSRLAGLNTTTTRPRTFTGLQDEIHDNAACIVVPQNHIAWTGLSLRGVTPKELSTFVNYHEFFHCMDDRYNKDTSRYGPQRREMFGDVGSLIETVRKGADPSIVDKVLEFRNREVRDQEHRTAPAILALKHYIKTHGAGALRKMDDRQVLDLAYKIVDDASKPWKVWMRRVAGDDNDLRSSIDARLHPVEAPEKHLPKGWDPEKVLQDKAFALGGKVTPGTLMQAHNTLQKEYEDRRDKNPASAPRYDAMMIYLENAYLYTVGATDYAGVNAARGAKLGDDDRRDIAFVKGVEREPAAPRPAAQHAKPGS